MSANDVAAMIVSTVQKSNLNFYLQESPFSININLRKSFIKNKNANNTIIQNNNKDNNNNASEKLKVEKLELENSSLYNSLRQIQAKLQEANDALHEVKQDNLKEVEKLGNENLDLKLKNDELKKSNEKLGNENNNLVEQLKIIKTENKSRINEITGIKNEINDKLAVKEVELNEAVEEKVKLEKKVTDLLDVLYGCPECGCNLCECNSSLSGDNSDADRNIGSPLPSLTPAAAVSFETPASLIPPPSSRSPWIPPPTPPCESCGGINFGPSPSSLCFECIPPLESKPPPDSSDSPSRTPPGTPPQQREGKARTL